MSDNEISKSKQKRMDIENARKKVKAQKNLRAFITILVLALIVCGTVAIYLYIKAKNAPFDYSKYLAEDGTIENINIDEYITIPLDSLSISADSITPDDEYIDNLINSELNACATIDSTKTSETGDRVNIYYEAYLGETLYNASTAENQGSDFIIGAASITEDFDNALIGHTAGDEYTVDITFPVTADADPLTAGQTVTYNIQFNGVYSVPEFDDAFVMAYHSDEASTASEYRQLLIDNYKNTYLPGAITDAILAQAVVNKYPDYYVEHIKKMLDEQNQLMLAMYSSQFPDLSLYSLVGCQNEEEYQAMLNETAYSNVTCVLAYQSIAKQLGITNTKDEVTNYLLEHGYVQEAIDQSIESYGYNYVANSVLQNRINDYLSESINITE